MLDKLKERFKMFLVPNSVKKQLRDLRELYQRETGRNTDLSIQLAIALNDADEYKDRVDYLEAELAEANDSYWELEERKESYMLEADILAEEKGVLEDQLYNLQQEIDELRFVNQ